MNEEDLSKFTDVIDEICDTQPLEICDSQPLSFASSNNTPVPQEDPLSKSRRPPKCTGQIGNFRCVEEIDPKYQHVFTYRYFNLVQSRVIEDALYSNKSIVVCAPTGSGKTVIFEMAIVQLLMELDDRNYTGDFKIIYMAPVKALCTERLTEWHSKFTKLGLLCIEVTGDTNVEFSQLQPYRIIITTPEKWDVLTRRWKDHRGLVEMVKLFLIDEVHILNDETRGPVLEAVVSRMKTIETSVQSAHRIEQLQAQLQGANVQCQESPPRIRFVAVSATVSNPEDVAAWLGNGEQPAVYHKFGDECRPVKIKRVVEGYPCAVGTSIFKFDIILNYKIWPIIQKYHNGKPTLIFCNSRKAVELTAETLSREFTVNFNEEQKAILAALASTVKNKKIQSLILYGLGCHHAGLLYEERVNIEQAFRNRDLPILITTTTLAMGVNLPAHLVIIKNTQQYVKGAYQEYSTSTILQMVGRAGRPQFDTEATAVIMTRMQDKARYQALVGGCEPLQSYLHKRLAENLNSEAALGTVGDVAQCVQWVNSTFLRVRAARDPKRYLNLPPSAPADLISKKIEELCVRAMNGLATAGLITMDEVSCIESTEAGRLMSLYYLDLETMKLIMKLEGTESLEQLLGLVCESHELADVHLRVDERRCLNALNRNRAAATVRFPMKGKINTRQMKLSCIIQAVLGCLPIPDPSLNQEAMKIMRTADRVCKCLVSYITRPNLISQQPKFYSAIVNSLILAKCISANLWENSPYVSRQLKGIGPTYATLLASAGKTNFMVLEESHPRDLERIMNKGPPAGNILRKQISLLPKYNLTMTPVRENFVRIQVLLVNQAHLAANMDNLTAGANHTSHIVVGDSENNLLYFKTFKDSDFISVYDGCIAFEVTRKHNDEHKVVAHCISSTLVGIDEKCEYVFMDINSLTEINTKDSRFPLHETSEKRDNMNQTTMDDVFKDRKRKLFNQNDTIQFKEKRKRDKNVIDSFKFLKESLEKTAKEIKEDFNKKSDMSHNLLQNVTKTTLPSNINSFTRISPNNVSDDDCKNQSLENEFSKNFEVEDIDNIDIDEEEVNGILSKIENEMKNKKHINSVALEPKPENQFSYFQKSDPVKYNYKRYSEPCKNMTAPVNRRKLNKKNNYTFLDKLEIRDTNDAIDIAETRTETGFSETVKPQIEKFMQRAQQQQKVKNSMLFDVTDFSNTKVKDLDTRDSINLTKDESLKNCEDVIDNNDRFLNSIDKANTLQLNAEKNHIHETRESLNSSIQKENLQSIKNIIPGQSHLQVMPYNDVTNKILTPTKLQDNNLKEIKLKVTDKVVKKQYSGTTSLPRLTISNDMPITVNNKVQIITPLNSQPNFVAKEINLVKTNNFHNQRDEYNYSESNTFEIPHSTEKIEKISTYSFGQTETFNICTKNSTKQQVQIISKLKVDLDVTEIVYKKDELSPETNEININTYNNNPKIVALETLGCQAAISNNDPYSKITSLENSKNKRFEINSSWSNGAKRNSALIGIVKSNTDFLGCNSKINKCQINLPLQNDDKYCNKYMFTGDSKLNNKANTSVKYGLQKNSNTVKRQNTNIYELQKFNKDASFSNQNSKVVMAKSSRKNKIKDRENAQIPPYQPLIVENKNTICQNTTAKRDNLMVKANSENYFEIQQSTRNQQIENYSIQSVSPHFNNIRRNFEEESPKIQKFGIMLSGLDSASDYSVNQCSDEIIPPPPEFCDSNNITDSSTFNDCFNDYKANPENSVHKQYLTENLSEDKLKPDLSNEANRTMTLDNVEHIESISVNNETILKENNSKEKSYNASAKDVLQKFSNIFKRQKEINTYKNFEIKNKNSDRHDIKPTIARTSRKYKIKDIDKIQITLPQALVIEKHNTTSQKMTPQLDNMLAEASHEKSYEIQERTQKDNMKHYIQDYSIEKSASAISIDNDTEEEDLEILSPDDMLSPLYSADDYSTNQAILNPKTLLECLNKADKDDIIASLPEIYDDNTNTYSPIYCDNLNTDKQNTEEIITQEYTDAYLQNDSENLETNNLNNSVLSLTTSKEVETWTLSQENTKSETFNSEMSWHSYNSRQTLRQNCNENKRESPKYAFNANNSRHAKLSYFKYERKPVYK